jgi:mannose-6-phosphate isomerase-like protein (cupin superfamily)
MREDFWRSLNESRLTGNWKFWENVFPEASVMDMTCLIEINQYLSVNGGKNAFSTHQPLLGPVHHDSRVKPFYKEFIENYDRVSGEVVWNSLLFFSLSDQHASFDMHSDGETVLLIQGYGEVGMVVKHANDPGNHQLLHLKTGDVLLMPPGTIHKPIPLGPRVTLSIGALPEKINNSSMNMNRA